jgi:hypothetical protein
MCHLRGRVAVSCTRRSYVLQLWLTCTSNDVARPGDVRVRVLPTGLDRLARFSGYLSFCFARDGSLLCLLPVLSWSCRIYSVYMFSVEDAC